MKTKHICFYLSDHGFGHIARNLPIIYRLLEHPEVRLTVVCGERHNTFAKDTLSPEQLARDKMRGALFENFIVTEALKRRYNQGKESNLYFYRDSNQNEVDLLLKKHSGLYGIEIKSAMTYHADFEKALKQMDGWVKETILGKAVAYAGTLENTAGEIKLLNYSHLDEVLA